VGHDRPRLGGDGDAGHAKDTRRGGEPESPPQVPEETNDPWARSEAEARARGQGSPSEWPAEQMRSRQEPNHNMSQTPQPDRPGRTESTSPAVDAPSENTPTGEGRPATDLGDDPGAWTLAAAEARGDGSPQEWYARIYAARDHNTPPSRDGTSDTTEQDDRAETPTASGELRKGTAEPSETAVRSLQDEADGPLSAEDAANAAPAATPEGGKGAPDAVAVAGQPDGPDSAVWIAERTEEDHPPSGDAPDRSRVTGEALADDTAVQGADDPPDRARPLSGTGTDPADLASTHQRTDDPSIAGGTHPFEADDPPASTSTAEPLADGPSLPESSRLADTTAEPAETPSGPRPDPPTGSSVDRPLDWTSWAAQVREKVAGPDLERRLGLAPTGDASLAELQTAVRYADAGYKVEVLVAVENQGVKNPDLKVQHVSKGDATWVEVKHRGDDDPMTKNFLDDVVTEANKQIKGAHKETAGRGHIVIDASTVPGLMSPVDVERFLNGKMTNTDSTSPRLLRIDYIEVLYRDPGNGHLMRSSMTRGADGRTAQVVTEDCEERR
jgi:hypothetical protein